MLLVWLWGIRVKNTKCQMLDCGDLRVIILLLKSKNITWSIKYYYCFVIFKYYYLVSCRSCKNTIWKKSALFMISGVTKFLMKLTAISDYSFVWICRVADHLEPAWINLSRVGWVYEMGRLIWVLLFRIVESWLGD